MNTPHNPRLAELLPAYALGALDGDDLRELEEHLAGGCEECRRQIDLWRGDLEELAAEVEPIVPSEITRARVLRLAGGIPEGAPVPRQRRSRRLWLWAAAATVLLGIALWGLLGQARMERQIEGLQAERDRLRRQVEELSLEVDRTHTEVAQARQSLQVIAAPGVQAVSLAGLGPSPGARGRTYVDPASRDALFYAFDLPALPADKTYQLWFIADGKPVSAGIFKVDPRGTASVRVERVAEIPRIQAWAVTIEPRGGVPQPTGAMVLKG